MTKPSVLVRPMVLLLCALLALPGCATTRAARAGFPPLSAQPAGTGHRQLMSDYIRQIPVGSRVRVSRASGAVIRGTLMKRDGDPIVVQRRTRIPEAPVEIALDDILAFELDTPGNNPARAVAIGAAAAVGATLGILMLLAAVFSD